MKLEAVLSLGTLATLVRQLTPLKILLGEEGGAERYLLLTDPDRITLVRDAGLRVTCKARLCWPVLGLTLPVSLNALSILLRPTIARRDNGEALVFQVEIQQIDLAGFPALVDAHVTDKVNKALSDRRVELVWDFTGTLSHSFPLPPMLDLVSTFDLKVVDGKVEIGEQTLRLVIAFGASVTRR
jgi:hypothetical protein